ncbi:MAG: endonuclease MutS2 [Treponema sp.]|nr:endonuclease MutS2 [Treponema sp.]
MEKTIALLEFDRIREAASSRALSTEAAKLIREEILLLDPEEIRARKNFVSSFCELIINSNNEIRQVWKELPEIGFLLPRLTVDGSILDIDEALALGLFLERGRELQGFVLNGSSLTETPLRTLAESVPDCSTLAREIFRIIDRDGTVKDLPEIKRIRSRILNLSKELEQIAGHYCANENTRRMLQSDVPSQRDGRLVLAVKANFRSRIKGIVHEVSATGQTVFMEPEESVEKNNQICVEQANLGMEIRRLLLKLSGSLAKHHDKLDQFHRVIVYLESLRARAQYSLELSPLNSGVCFAREPSPTIHERSGPALVLKQARHPLIAAGTGTFTSGKAAVPIDLLLDPGTKMVIVTGPNTGGKTVALKTIGLFALMNQAGFALPAAEAVLPFFNGIFADIGDEQSLSQSLSTFSAHMTNIAMIIEKATEHSLVLLDELGAGTDPEEGSAIAMAILDHFIETKSTVVLTTHHGMLKNYGYSREGVENASVDFDSHTLSPTYRIIMGIPGESRALDIAARNGFPPALVQKARSYLNEERSDVSALIAGLKEKHRELDKVSFSAKKEEERLREDRRKTDLKALSLRQKEQHLKQEGAAEFRRFLAESRKNLENLVREIREGELSREKTLKVKDFIRVLEEKSAAISTILEVENETLNGQSWQVMPGAEVLAGPSKSRGRVIRRDQKKPAKNIAGKTESFWIVETGSLRISFPERELSPPDSGQNNTQKAGADSVGWAAELVPEKTNAMLEINLLGMRFEEAMETLRRQIDAAVLAGLQEFSVVHGKGDGILQKGVHDYLTRDPAVAEYHFSRPELGGTGRTEVVLHI